MATTTCTPTNVKSDRTFVFFEFLRTDPEARMRSVYQVESTHEADRPKPCAPGSNASCVACAKHGISGCLALKCIESTKAGVEEAQRLAAEALSQGKAGLLSLLLSRPSVLGYGALAAINDNFAFSKALEAYIVSATTVTTKFRRPSAAKATTSAAGADGPAPTSPAGPDDSQGFLGCLQVMLAQPGLTERGVFKSISDVAFLIKEKAAATDALQLAEKFKRLADGFKSDDVEMVLEKLQPLLSTPGVTPDHVVCVAAQYGKTNVVEALLTRYGGSLSTQTTFRVLQRALKTPHPGVPGIMRANHTVLRYLPFNVLRAIIPVLSQPLFDGLGIPSLDASRWNRTDKEKLDTFRRIIRAAAEHEVEQKGRDGLFETIVRAVCTGSGGATFDDATPFQRAIIFGSIPCDDGRTWLESEWAGVGRFVALLLKCGGSLEVPDDNCMSETQFRHIATAIEFLFTTCTDSYSRVREIFLPYVQSGVRFTTEPLPAAVLFFLMSVPENVFECPYQNYLRDSDDETLIKVADLASRATEEIVPRVRVCEVLRVLLCDRRLGLPDSPLHPALENALCRLAKQAHRFVWERAETEPPCNKFRRLVEAISKQPAQVPTEKVPSKGGVVAGAQQKPHPFACDLIMFVSAHEPEDGNLTLRLVHTFPLLPEERDVLLFYLAGIGGAGTAAIEAILSNLGEGGLHGMETASTLCAHVVALRTNNTKALEILQQKAPVGNDARALETYLANTIYRLEGHEKAWHWNTPEPTHEGHEAEVCKVLAWYEHNPLDVLTINDKQAIMQLATDRARIWPGYLNTAVGLVRAVWANEKFRRGLPPFLLERAVEDFGKVPNVHPDVLEGFKVCLEE